MSWERLGGVLAEIGSDGIAPSPNVDAARNGLIACSTMLRRIKGERSFEPVAEDYVVQQLGIERDAVEPARGDVTLGVVFDHDEIDDE